ncbi:Outer membrane usher protein FimD [Pseudomonas sp. AD21]|uniref:fimbria/pilus outer membrane usher protein n=1 Tax=Pseudomonas sp. AD21 TaxID=396378 RepID=UPI000CA9051D|nr:fimbria/pilus outer membrane usher protein [Pseudomonas sp. AD21]PMQ08167.1 Outer membrane usher protein FimD [Pseudomonas sp. AD21]
MYVFRKKANPKLVNRASGSCVFFLGMTVPVAALSVEFNESFLSKGGAKAELKYFEQGSSLSPGRYAVDIYLNQILIVRQDIEFAVAGDNGEVRPIIQLGVLQNLGVNVDRLRRENVIAQDSDDQSVIDVATLAPGAAVEFDVNSLALQFSIPQAYVQRQPRSYVDPSLWDQGITAFYTNYQTNFSRNINQGNRNDYRYIGLRNGFNIGAWRLRNESSIIGTTGTRNKFSSNRSYVERDLIGLKAKLAAGELYTQGDIFDSVRFRGAQISSELGMLPDNEIGFAPVVRGIAETNATVEISQNDYVIYSTTVSPGAFEISDIFPSGSNGDLKVKIIESDGRERQYSQAYSYLPVMTRRGSARYSFAGGQYQSQGTGAPKFGQGTLVYGVSDNVTGYGGALTSKQYRALNLGLGLNTSLGGLSFDVTSSTSADAGGRKNTGKSARFLYSKTLSSTDTTFTMVGYRYSTEGYRTFSQHVDEQGYIGGSSYGRQKSRFDMNINQSFADRGSLFVSLGETSYWNRQGSTRRWQFGYSGSYSDTSYSFAVSRTDGQAMVQGADTQITASISMPFGSSKRSQRAFSSVTSSTQGDSSIQSGIAGSLTDDNNLMYSAQAGHSTNGSTNGDLGLSWDTPKAKINGNYGQGQGSTHINAGASGSMVVHGGGVTFGQPVGETFALVEVPGVADVGVASAGATRTDRKGYAVVPYAQPYRFNWINLDTSTLGSDMEVSDTSRMVVPTRGAIVKGRFEAQTGRRMQLTLSLDNGKKIPFGAQAFDEKGNVSGVVDNLSRLLVFGVKDKGVLDIRWSNGSCRASYDVPPAKKDMMYEKFDVVCSFASI